ncbi:uncharacterized protein LOC126183225 [Schistocerca cancellata]|uniref:uncharacterized protein LOC126183225 n=1 Tax=Schistocerca cancellata TaxID=274614 RepID=UPI0021186357|nr:uncharacterized protein LOC126183225 [Schistocerca cancellata]
MASPQSPDVLSEFYRLQNQQTQALLDALGQLVQGQRALQNDAAAAAPPLPQPQHAVAPPFRPFDAALESWTEWSRQFGFHLAAYRIQGTEKLYRTRYKTERELQSVTKSWNYVAQ